MTILAFKVPGRVASRPKAQYKGTTKGKGKGGGRRSRGRPERRRNPYPRKPNVYTVKTWRPPVPEPLPPAPLLSLPSLGLIGLSVLLSQLWGRLNGPARSAFKGKTDYPGNIENLWVTGSYSETGSTRVFTSTGDQTWIGAMRNFNYLDRACEPLIGVRNGIVGKTITGFKGIYIEREGVGSCTPNKTTIWGAIDGAGVRHELVRTSTGNSTGSYQEIVGKVRVESTAPGATSTKEVPEIYPWTSPEPIPAIGAAELSLPAAQAALPWLPKLPLPVANPALRRLPGLLWPEGDPALPELPGLPLPEGDPGSPPRAPARTPRPSWAPVKLPSDPMVDVKAPPVLDARPILPDGSVKPLPKPEVPVTDPDVVYPWPGSPPVGGGGQSPAPDLPAIAKEVGRIERKLEIMNGAGGRPPSSPDNPVDLLGLARAIYELLMSTGFPPTYTLDSPCELDDEGNRLPPIEIPVNPAFSVIGSVANRVDALALLLQAHKDLKQPTCSPSKPTYSGEWVTVKFESTEKSSNGERPLRKKLRYLDQTSSVADVHVGHWEQFVWQAGPVCVIHKGAAWGVPQVWAATADEGKRVIRHAGQVAGIDVDKEGVWIVTGSSDPRYGRRGTMRVEIRKGLLGISKRPSPNGLPAYPMVAVSP